MITIKCMKVSQIRCKTNLRGKNWITFQCFKRSKYIISFINQNLSKKKLKHLILRLSIKTR